jgi:hypothetical protein
MLRQHWPKLVGMALFALMIVIVSCSEDTTEPVTVDIGGTLVVASLPAGEEIVIDGVADAAWDKVKQHYVVLDDSLIKDIDDVISNTEDKDAMLMRLKAIADEEYFYLLAGWSDTSGADVTPDQWYFDPSGNPDIRNLGHGEGGQDFFFAMFDDGRNTSVGADCWKMCHIEKIDDSLHTYMENGGPGMVDAWIWKAGQTDPTHTLDDIQYLSGERYSNDVTVQNIPVWEQNIRNLATDRRPKYMHQDTVDYTGEFLFQTEKIDFHDQTRDTSGKFLFWPQTYHIPGYVVRESVTPSDNESLWEIEAKGSYDNVEMTWTLEIKRKLNTGHPDDIPFVKGSTVDCSVGITKDMTFFGAPFNKFRNITYPPLASRPFQLKF